MYKSGDNGNGFYFMMQGSLELLVMQAGELKFSKQIAENSIFGQKKFHTEDRTDNAKITSETAVIIEFDTEKYKNIVSQT